jgi:hypothetical protein
MSLLYNDIGGKMIKDLFIIDDNFLTQQEIKDIEFNLFNNTTYSFLEVGGAKTDGIHGISGESFCDAPLFMNFSMSENDNNSSFAIANFILNKFVEKHNIKIKEITRSRANISFTSNDRRHTPPHIDDRQDHYVFLYYVNDSDGNTNIYNEKFDGVTKRTEKDLTLFKSIEPVAGRGMLFSGHVFHTWQPPVNNKIRCIVNMNVIL